MDNFQLVVGNIECPINTVVLTIQPSPVNDKWPILAMGLNVENEHIKKFRKDLLLDKITHMEIMCEVLELWIAGNRSTPTLGKLLSVVEGLCGANDAGESLRLRFHLPCKAADGNPSIHWNDIPTPFQTRITETFQNFFPSLRFSNTLPQLNGAALIQLMTGKKPQLFVHPFPETLPYYINRTLVTRNVISKQIFEQDSEDIFLFSRMDPSELSALAGSMLTGSSSEQLLYSVTVKFMILDKPHHFETICEKNKYPVHLLKREDDGRLRWIRSTGRMDNLQKYVDQSQDEFDEEAFCRHLNSETTSVLICDSPGIGKSVLLAHIGSTLSQLGRTVVFIAFIEFIKQVKSIETEDEIKMIEVALQKLTREGVVHSNTEETIVTFELLLDGFDELDSADFELARSILSKISTLFKSTRLWVTSRPHLTNELETSLNVLGYNIRPFNAQDQVQFLSSFWSRKKPLDKRRSRRFARKCLESLNSRMDSRSQNIAGIPLQCLLIGEVYEKDAVEYARVGGDAALVGIEIRTITDLYRRLIRKKIDKYESLNGKLAEDELMGIHARLGLELMYPDEMEALRLGPIRPDYDELYKVGIIVKSLSMESSYVFMHWTFAEYFVAWFVVDKLVEGEWSGEINAFFLHSILDIVYYKFVQPVICFFLNAFIADFRGGSGQICSQLDTESAELMQIIAHACANDDLVHIFKLFHERYESDKSYTSRIFTKYFLDHSVEYSSLELVKPIVTQLEKHDKLSMEVQAEALCNAVRLGKFSIVQFFIKKKSLSDIVKDLSYGTEALMVDCVKDTLKYSDEEIKNQIQVLRMLIQTNGSLLNNKVDGRPPLLFDSVNVKLLIELVRLGADVFATDKYSYTVLHLSYNRGLCRRDYHSLLMSIPDESLRHLVHGKAFGHTPLTSALQWIDPTRKTLDKFRDVGADFSYTNSKGYSVIALAIANGRSAVTIRKIIQHGGIKVLGRAHAVPNMQHLSTNLLHTAAKLGNVEAVGVLVDEHGIDVNSEDERGRTPLDLVIESNKVGDRFATGLALKERGGRFKHDNSLIAAVINGNEQSVRLLLRFGVDVNRRDENGDTALHKSLEPRDEIKYFPHGFTIVQLLLDSGAELTALNNMGETPVDTAKKNENLDAKISLLLKSKTDGTS